MDSDGLRDRNNGARNGSSMEPFGVRTTSVSSTGSWGYVTTDIGGHPDSYDLHSQSFLSDIPDVCDEDLAERLTHSLELHSSYFMVDDKDCKSLSNGPSSLPGNGIAPQSPHNGTVPCREAPNASSSSEVDQGDKIKTKLLSAWNNMRHGKKF